MNHKEDNPGCGTVLIEMLLMLAALWMFFASLAWIDMRITKLEEVYDISRPPIVLFPDREEDNE